MMVSPSSFEGFELDAHVCRLPASAQVYLVGGAVRDRLMGRPSHDKDWVVVGATVADMLQAGFKPVGADFPVFLHPETQEEYALARTERKSGHGYKGFCFYAEPTVRLEEDLARRDFTINAMALDSNGVLIDPYGGQRDLGHQVFRHVSPAFVEDPLRVLRLARFLARFHGFQVHNSTTVLCQQLRDSGELSHLVAERVFSELNRGLSEAQPSKMLEFLMHLRIWSALLPKVDWPFEVLTSEHMLMFDRLQGERARWAYGLGCLLSLQKTEYLVLALKVPNEVSQLARVVAQVFAWLQDQQQTGVDVWERVLAAVDVYRKPERLHQALAVLLQVVGKHAVLSVFQHAVSDQISGQYKQALRVYLAERCEEKNMAERVLSFKRLWVCQLLSRGAP